MTLCSRNLDRQATGTAPPKSRGTRAFRGLTPLGRRMTPLGGQRLGIAQDGKGAYVRALDDEWRPRAGRIVAGAVALSSHPGMEAKRGSSRRCYLTSRGRGEVTPLDAEPVPDGPWHRGG